MQKYVVLVFSAYISAAAALCAQEAPSAAAASASPSPVDAAAPSLPAAGAPVEPPQLIPSPPLPAPSGPGAGSSALPDLSQLDQAFKQSPVNKAVQDYRLHVEWRQLQNRTANDAAVVAAKEDAERSRTDLEKRKRLQAYYATYYSRMRALASTPEMKAYLDGQKGAHLAMLAQPRVRPTPQPTATPPAGRRKTR